MEFVVGGLFVAIAALVGVTPKLWTMRLEKKAAELEVEIQSLCWHIEKPWEGDKYITSTLINSQSGATKCRRCQALLGPDSTGRQRLADLFGRHPKAFLQQYNETQTGVLNRKINQLTALHRRLKTEAS